MSYYFSKTLASTFADAVARTKEVLVAHGFGVLSEIDIASTLKVKLGVDTPPYVILGACNPQYAHHALQIESKIGTMLPCNVIVREASPGSIEVAAVDPVASMQAVENAALTAVAEPVRGLLERAIADL